MAKRGDDTPETLELRMLEYADKTAPLVDHFQERGLLHKVDARGLPEVVFASIVEILEEA
jgi:adenylate kinase